MAFPPMRRRVSRAYDADASSAPAGSSENLQDDARDAHDLRHDFNALMGRYQRQVYNTVFRLIGDAEEAGDLTQETFVSAFRARADFRGDARVSTWLYRIAVNHCKNKFKQRNRQREFEGPSLDAGSGISGEDGGVSETKAVADWSLSPEVLAERQELKAAIMKAIDNLAPEYRTVLVLREMEGLNYNEIVEVTGLTLETVKTRLSRARGMIRRKIEPYYRMS